MAFQVQHYSYWANLSFGRKEETLRAYLGDARVHGTGGALR